VLLKVTRVYIGVLCVVSVCFYMTQFTGMLFTANEDPIFSLYLQHSTSREHLLPVTPFHVFQSKSNPPCGFKVLVNRAAGVKGNRNLSEKLPSDPDLHIIALCVWQ